MTTAAAASTHTMPSTSPSRSHEGAKNRERRGRVMGSKYRGCDCNSGVGRSRSTAPSPARLGEGGVEPPRKNWRYRPRVSGSISDVARVLAVLRHCTVGSMARRSTRSR